MKKVRKLDTSAVNDALTDLRKRITVSLRAFNDATPHASWLRRSEIARITEHALRVAENASRRRTAPIRMIKSLLFGLRHRRRPMQPSEQEMADKLAREPSPGSAERQPGGAERTIETTPRQEYRALASIVRIRQ
jgi:hypothetical protein